MSVTSLVSPQAAPWVMLKNLRAKPPLCVAMSVGLGVLLLFLGLQSVYGSGR